MIRKQKAPSPPAWDGNGDLDGKCGPGPAERAGRGGRSFRSIRRVGDKMGGRPAMRGACQAKAWPSARHSASALSSGAPLQITPSLTRAAPAPWQLSAQLRIHSPSPQP